MSRSAPQQDSAPSASMKICRNQDKQNDDQRQTGKKNVANVMAGLALADPLFIVFRNDWPFIHEAAPLHGVSRLNVASCHSFRPGPEAALSDAERPQQPIRATGTSG
jgi:hypothetical protein